MLEQRSDIEPQIALVTGSGRRIGREIALGLAHAGWDICVHYGNSESSASEVVGEIRALGRRAEAVRADLCNEDEVSRLIPDCIALLGTPTCVVNSASAFEYDSASTFEYSLLLQLTATNLAAPLMLARGLHHALGKSTVSGQRAGVVINILDQKLFALNPDHLSYTLTKAALKTATLALAQAFFPEIRVVGIAPGLTLGHPSQSEEEFQELHRRTPLGRGSSVADIVQACCFVVDNPSITGTTLIVDGGQHLAHQNRDTLFLLDEDGR